MYDEEQYESFIVGLLKSKAKFNSWEWDVRTDNISCQFRHDGFWGYVGDYFAQFTMGIGYNLRGVVFEDGAEFGRFTVQSFALMEN